MHLVSITFPQSYISTNMSDCNSKKLCVFYVYCVAAILFDKTFIILCLVSYKKKPGIKSNSTGFPSVHCAPSLIYIRRNNIRQFLWGRVLSQRSCNWLVPSYWINCKFVHISSCFANTTGYYYDPCYVKILGTISKLFSKTAILISYW